MQKPAHTMVQACTAKSHLRTPAPIILVRGCQFITLRRPPESRPQTMPSALQLGGSRDRPRPKHLCCNPPTLVANKSCTTRVS